MHSQATCHFRARAKYESGSSARSRSILIRQKGKNASLECPKRRIPYCKSPDTGDAWALHLTGGQPELSSCQRCSAVKAAAASGTFNCKRYCGIEMDSGHSRSRSSSGMAPLTSLEIVRRALVVRATLRCVRRGRLLNLPPLSARAFKTITGKSPRPGGKEVECRER